MDHLPEVNNEQLANPAAQDIFKPRRKTHLKVIVGMSLVAMVAIGVVIGLMWQSNSFIAQNQDVRSDASQPIGSDAPASPADTVISQKESPETLADGQANQSASTTSLRVPGQVYTSPFDNRFGINGGCAYAQMLNMPWTYNWGWMNNADRVSMKTDNINEIRCYQNTRTSSVPVDTLITLAKNDGITTDSSTNASAAWSETDLNNWKTKAQNESKWDSKAQRDFAELQATFPNPTCDIQNTIDGVCSQNPGKRFNIHRILVDYIQIPYIVAQYPGAHYQIANEPDFGFSFMPDKYAKLYRIFYDRIKAFDPNAKVTIGSLGLVEFDHPFNQVETTFKRNTAYDWVINQLIAKGMDTPKNRDIAWLALVYSAYQAQNPGKYPQVDFVALHPYPWPPNLSQEYLRFKNGNFYSYQWPTSKVAQAVQDTVSQIDKFKSATSNPPYRYNWKPLWVTELNILVNKNATKAERDAEAEALQKPYMQQVYQALIPTQKVKKIFWHTGLNDSYQPTSHIESGFVFQTTSRPSGLNVLGEELVRLKANYRDSRPPSITALTLSHSGNNATNRIANVQVGVSDTPNTGETSSALYRLWYTAFLSTQDPPPVPTNWSQWSSLLTTSASTSFKFKPPVYNQPYWFAIQAEDAYGNVSAATLKRMQ